jgi:hypothetical protein
LSTFFFMGGTQTWRYEVGIKESEMNQTHLWLQLTHPSPSYCLWH